MNGAGRKRECSGQSFSTGVNAWAWEKELAAAETKDSRPRYTSRYTSVVVGFFPSSRSFFGFSIPFHSENNRKGQNSAAAHTGSANALGRWRNGCCHTFPEPEVEEELAPSCCFRVLSRRERVRSTIYSGSSAGPNVAMKKVFKGRHHSPYRRSVAEAAAVQDLCRGRPQVVTSTGFGLILYAAISPGLC